jgi:putative membrane protein
MRIWHYLATTVLAAGIITAQTTSDDQNGGKLSAGDQAFIQAVATAGMTEVAVAKLGIERASDVNVKSYAQKLFDDHTKMNTELTAIAQKKGVAIPAVKSGSGAETALSSATGKDFDRLFLKHMVDEHEKAVALFEQQQNTSDMDLKTFIDTNLPTLRSHLEQAKSLQSIGG